jgi:hypothetical protein
MQNYLMSDRIADARTNRLREIKTFAVRSKAIETDRAPTRRSKRGEVGICLLRFDGVIVSAPEGPLPLRSIDFRDEQRPFL